MSFPTANIYANLIHDYPSWEALKVHLMGDGLRLRVDDGGATPDSPYALIRYVKGQSDMENPVVRAFRSVVWDTLAHRPVSVTSWKSADCEVLPESEAFSDSYRVETFHDGTLIGLFWDSYRSEWRIHTRSVLDARCRYFSEDKTFADMFWPVFRDTGLDRTQSYSFVLQHPENRIVCAVSAPRALLTDRCTIAADGTVTWSAGDISPPPPGLAFTSWDSVRGRLAELNGRFRHNFQGFVVKTADGHRWKIRTAEYNRVRTLRGNSPRRDYLWLSGWKNNTLRDYLTLFPEERGAANALINRWKDVTTEVYRLYCEAFKARTLERKNIPPKYRPLVYGLHSLYIETLKPAGKTVDWRACLEYMNGREVPQMLFVLSWDFRAAQRVTGAVVIPLEPPVTAGTTIVAEVEEAKTGHAALGAEADAEAPAPSAADA
jgi:hypothetical protein